MNGPETMMGARRDGGETLIESLTVVISRAQSLPSSPRSREQATPPHAAHERADRVGVCATSAEATSRRRSMVTGGTYTVSYPSPLPTG
jgi:hypothetical protein